MTALRQSKFSVGDRVRIADKYKSTYNSIKGNGTIKLVRPYGERNLYLVEFDDKKFQKEFLSYQLELVPKKTTSKTTKNTKTIDAIPKINKEEINTFTKRVDRNIEMVNCEAKERKREYPTIEDHEEPKFNVGQAVIFTPNALLLLKEKSSINVNEMYREFIITAHNIIGGKYVYNLRESNLRVSDKDIVLASTDKVKAHLQILDLMSNYHKLKNEQRKS